jgi:molybdopterin synthase catalytic subunit
LIGDLGTSEGHLNTAKGGEGRRSALINLARGPRARGAREGTAVTDVEAKIEDGTATLTQPTPPESGDWVGVGAGPLPVEAAWRWAILPGCGGIVTFCGTVRDHSDGRPGVTVLEYEAYVEQVGPRLTRVASAARERWEEIGRLVLLHRVGRLEVGEVSVVVVASTPHRAEAFAAAQFCIDTLKHTVPIWKRETWSGGTDWTVCSNELDAVSNDQGPVR